MRHRFAFLALVALTTASCSDVTPSGAGMARHIGPMSGVTLSDYIQLQIDELLPRGFEASVDARWATVQQKKNSGDMVAAVKHLNTLAAWITRKTGEITPPSGMTKGQAAVLLVTNMARWVHFGDSAPITTVPSADVAVAIVPAGAPLFMQTPSHYAGVSWNAGSTNEERIVVLMADPTVYEGHCTGPLVTSRCQYPLFYKLESYPKLRLINTGRFAVCMVEDGARRPLEYTEDEGEGGARPIDNRMRVAHDRPANAADYTPGAVQEEGIEILPKSQNQSGELVHCDEPNPLAMGKVERALYAASQFASKFLSPEKAWAYDSGPEHDFSFFSSFNGVDPVSSADLGVTGMTVAPAAAAVSMMTASYTIENKSRRSGGDATGTSAATVVRAWLSTDQYISTGDISLGSAVVPAMLPDATPYPVSHTFAAPTAAAGYYVIVKVDSVGTETAFGNNLVTQSFAITAPGPTGQQEQPAYDGSTGFQGIGGGPTSQQMLAQVFTPAITGKLTSVSFPVGCSNGTLVVEVKAVTAGLPTATVLARQFVPAASLPPFIEGVYFQTITFATPANVTANDQVAIVLRMADPDNESCGIASGPTGDPYAFGDAYYDARPNTAGVWVPMSGGRKDLPFKTLITVDDIDQQNLAQSGTSFSCGNGSGLPLFQGFTPTATTLSGVELMLRFGGSFPATGMNTTIRVRSGSATGTILGTASTYATEQTTGSISQVRYRFDPALVLTPGSLYVIELQSVEPALFSWLGEDTSNPYAGGTAYNCSGTSVAGWDLVFTTHR